MFILPALLCKYKRYSFFQYFYAESILYSRRRNAYTAIAIEKQTQEER